MTTTRRPFSSDCRWLRERRNPYAGLSLQEAYEGLARTRLRRRPGERIRYSNLGVGLLGEALAGAAGQPYEGLVQERICLPLGMPDTVVDPSAEQAARLAGAGDLRSTASDMLRFLEAYLDPPRGPARGPAGTHPAAATPDGQRTGMGLGWLLVRSREPAGPLLWHNGFRSSWASSGSVASPWSCSATPPGRSTGSTSGSCGPCRPAA